MPLTSEVFFFSFLFSTHPIKRLPELDFETKLKKWRLEHHQTGALEICFFAFL